MHPSAPHRRHDRNATRSNRIDGRQRCVPCAAGLQHFSAGRAGSNAVFAFLVRIASAVILYVSQILLARWMGDTEYGIYVVVWTWVLLLGGLSTLGLSTAMMRLLPEQREQGTFDLMRGLLLGGRVAPVAFSAGVAIAGLLGLQLLGSAMDSHYLLPAYLALVCLPLVTLTDLQDGIGRANGWVGVALLPPYVMRPLIVLAAMIIAHEAGLEMSAATAVAAAIVATAATAILQTWLLGRRLRSTIPVGPRIMRCARGSGCPCRCSSSAGARC
ncbi:MAG: oligosaccharide flippase family protein [Rhodospirillales bacterium]|nr:oligosaccharide flippase family protein [Rhodospirillales bacterium]